MSTTRTIHITWTMLLLLAVSCVLGACTMRVHRMASKPTAGVLFDRVDSSAGDAAGLDYAVYIPRGLEAHDAAKPVPLVVFLHGKGESGRDGQKMLVQGIGTNIFWNADRWPCVVLFPQKPDAEKQWEEYDALVMAAVARVRERYAIDPERIALTGLSQGGHGTWALGSRHPELWSRLAPICGYPDLLDPDAIARAIARVPVWCFHGDADDVVPVAKTQRMVDALRAAGSDPRVTIYPGVNHGSWDRAYADPDLPAWLLAPRKH